MARDIHTLTTKVESESSSSDSLRVAVAATHVAGEKGEARAGDAAIPAAIVGEFQARQMKNRVLGRLLGRTERLTIGRYDILESIGQGGMGVVYAAYDNELDRKIALKLLQGDGLASDTAKLRFKREAQAMAKLSHTNIVTVHEVGEADDKVFIAMEFVRGQSLDEWCQEPRRWSEVTEVFIQAGRGLIAAHDAGLVHRDLKPHNIMRGDDGVVKVLDFGLARAAHGPPSSEWEDAQISSGSFLDVALTRTGAFVGTPAYMAPEVYKKLPADARSDQFSFCAALYQALYGQLPFEGGSLKELRENIAQSNIQPPPPERAVPSWLHRILTRGLAASPDQRWPSMRALVDALSRDPAARRRRLTIGVGLATLTGGAGFAVAGLVGAPVTDCGNAAAVAAELWSGPRRDRVVAGLRGSGHHLAEPTIERVLPMLDAYAGAWSTMRVEACETHSSGQQSDRMFDLRTACLDRQRVGLNTLLDAFEQADAGVVESAAWATASLPRLRGCADVEALTARVPPPEDPAHAREVKQLRETLTEARALVGLGRHDKALARAGEVLERASELRYTPLFAEARLQMGTAQLESYRFERSLESLSESVGAAIRAGHDEVAAEALARRLWILAVPLARGPEGARDGHEADAYIDKLGSPLALRWLYLNNRGGALYAQGDMEAAEVSLNEALALLRGADEPLPVEAITTGFNLGVLLHTRGRTLAAYEQLRDTRLRAIDLLGAEHPRVAQVTDLLVGCLYELGRHREGLALLQRASETLHPSATYVRAQLLVRTAQFKSAAREYAEALTLAEQVVTIADAEFKNNELRASGLYLRGLARVGVGDTERGLVDLQAAIDAELTRVGTTQEGTAHARWWAGTGMLIAGRVDEAIAELERANTIYAGLANGATEQLGRHAFRLVEALLQRGDLERAGALIEKTLTSQREAGFPDDNEHRSMLYKLRGDLRVARGQRARAAADYERACAWFSRIHDPDDPILADCQLGWARALGADPRARTLAAGARDIYMSLGAGFEQERAAAALLADADSPPGAP